MLWETSSWSHGIHVGGAERIWSIRASQKAWSTSQVSFIIMRTDLINGKHIILLFLSFFSRCYDNILTLSFLFFPSLFLMLSFVRTTVALRILTHCFMDLQWNPDFRIFLLFILVQFFYYFGISSVEFLDSSITLFVRNFWFQ